MNHKIVKCSICSRPIKTATGGILGDGSHITCRSCFGESSYTGSTQWSYHPVVGGK